MRRARLKIGRNTLLVALVVAAGPAHAQRSLEPKPAKSTLPELSLPKSSPGALETSDVQAPDVSIVAGRKRGGVIPKRAAQSPRQVSEPTLSPLEHGIARPSADVFPDGAPVDGEGPANGITLDEAVARMIAENIELRAFAKEIPQAEADLLTAGLRTNPLLFADTQFIPYGANNASRRPIGPTQYDVALIMPVDVSGKRRDRIRVACAARSVVQAQYQDAVRRQIANVCHAFVDLQVAYQARLAIEQERIDHEQLLKDYRPDSGAAGGSLQTWKEKWLAAHDENDDALGDAREALGLLLNVSPEDSSQLSPRGRLRVDPPVLPPLDELIRIATRYRPDLAAARLGITRADAEIGLAKANRQDDVILFYDPLSYQDNRPAHLPSGRSWDVGITVPLQVFNRNQGNIAKARTNAHQSRLEYAALERRMVSEVRLASRELKAGRDILDRIEQTIRPDALKSIRDAKADLLAKRITAEAYAAKLDDEQDSARQQRDALVRYRRATLDLNSVLGTRILP